MSRSLREQLADIADEITLAPSLDAPSEDPDYHNYNPSPARLGRLRGAGQPFLVVNGEQRALRAVPAKNIANAQAELSPSRKVVDLAALPYHNRRYIADVLATRLSSSSRFEGPEPRASSIPKASGTKEKLDEVELLMSEMRKLVGNLELAEHDHAQVLPVVLKVAITAGREAALDLIRDIEFLQYTCVHDRMTDQIIARFSTAKEASNYLRSMLELPPEQWQILDGAGNPTGRYRYKTVKPNYQSGSF